MRYGCDDGDLEDNVDDFCLASDKDVYVARKPLKVVNDLTRLKLVERRLHIGASIARIAQNVSGVNDLMQLAFRKRLNRV